MQSPWERERGRFDLHRAYLSGVIKCVHAKQQQCDKPHSYLINLHHNVKSVGAKSQVPTPDQWPPLPLTHWRNGYLLLVNNFSPPALPRNKKTNLTHGLCGFIALLLYLELTTCLFVFCFLFLILFFIFIFGLRCMFGWY